jgi:putative transposase
LIFHVMNRAARRLPLFTTSADYRLFQAVLREVQDDVPLRLLSYCVMPNHWHLVVWPEADHQLSRFMHRLTYIHAQRWHHAHATTGTGAVYQGRFKAVAVQCDRHLLTAIRYVEQNPLRAGLVTRPQDWRWSSAAPFRAGGVTLAEWPITRPADWVTLLEGTAAEQVIRPVRESLAKGVPYGDRAFVERTSVTLKLEGRLRGRGRPSGARTARSQTCPS